MSNKDKYIMYSAIESDMSSLANTINKYLDWHPDYELFNINTVFDPSTTMCPVKSLVILKKMETTQNNIKI